MGGGCRLRLIGEARGERSVAGLLDWIRVLWVRSWARTSASGSARALTEIGDTAGELFDAHAGKRREREGAEVAVEDGGASDLAGGEQIGRLSAEGGDERGLFSEEGAGLGGIEPEVEEQFAAAIGEPDIFPIAAPDHAFELTGARGAKHAYEGIAGRGRVAERG